MPWHLGKRWEERWWAGCRVLHVSHSGYLFWGKNLHFFHLLFPPLVSLCSMPRGSCTSTRSCWWKQVHLHLHPHPAVLELWGTNRFAAPRRCRDIIPSIMPRSQSAAFWHLIRSRYPSAYPTTGGMPIMGCSGPLRTKEHRVNPEQAVGHKWHFFCLWESSQALGIGDSSEKF